MNTTFADYREPFCNVGIARDDSDVTGAQMHTDGATQHFGRAKPAPRVEVQVSDVGRASKSTNQSNAKPRQDACRLEEGGN
jgi:hypothetical protein